MDNQTDQRKLAAIMFTDMLGFSSLSQRDEALALSLLTDCQNLIREQLPRFKGREVKCTGDGFLLEFASALEATQCAIEIQQEVATRNSTQPAERELRVRVGIHVGDVVHRDGDIFGDGVNIAARIEPLAIGGGICLSDTVYSQVHNKLDLNLTKLESPQMKGIDVPMDVYRIVLPWEEIPAAARKPRSPRKKWLVLSLGIAACAIAILVWLLTQNRPTTNPLGAHQTGAPPEGQNSVAVLPFVNMGADKSDEYLSDGMTEELLNALAQVKGLRVPGRTSSFAFKGKNDENIFREVGDRLHVRTVLEGSVRRVGGRLRVTAQLINVADGFHIWSETYDRDMNNVLAIQTEIASRVATALKGQLGLDEARTLAKNATVNPEAHRLYLLGRYQFSKDTAAGYSEATKDFEEAIRLDPNYALPYCGLADNYGWMGGYAMPPRAAFAKEKELAKKALNLDPNLAEAHLSYGIALETDFDWEGARSEIKRALELNPNLALAYDQLACIHTFFNELDEALTEERKAVDLDPLSPLLLGNYCHELFLARRFQEGNAQARAILGLNPKSANVHRLLGWAAIWQSRPSEAITEFRKGYELDSLGFYEVYVSHARAVLGDRSPARQVLGQLQERVKNSYVSPMFFAIVYLDLGDNARALSWMEKTVDERDPGCAGFKVAPIYKVLAGEPRYQALLKKMGVAN